MSESLEKARSVKIPKIVADITNRGEDPTSDKNRKYAAGVLARQWAVSATSDADIQKTLAQRFIPSAEKAIHDHLSKLYPDRKIEVPVQKDPYPVRTPPPTPVVQPEHMNHPYHARWMSLENQLANHFESGAKEYPEQWQRAANAYQSAEEHHGAYDSPYKRSALGHLKTLLELKRTPVKEESIPNPPKEALNFTDKPLTRNKQTKVTSPTKEKTATPVKSVKEKKTPLKAAKEALDQVRPVKDKAKTEVHPFDRAVNKEIQKQTKLQAKKKPVIDDPENLPLNVHGRSIDQF
jgi:hypothetical protein